MKRVLLSLLLCASISTSVYWQFFRNSQKKPLEVTDVLKILEQSLKSYPYPTTIKWHIHGEEKKINIDYTLDPKLQAQSISLLNRYKPDYGAIVILDAETGEILSLAETSVFQHQLGHLGLKAIFPSASVFKIITASAAIDLGKAFAESEFQFNGTNSSLYKRNVKNVVQNRWTRTVTLREAFALSINTVFGRIGLMELTHDELSQYSKHFLFNRKIPSQIPLDISIADFNFEDDWERAEIASGYTRKIQISPLHGALIASVFANQGEMPTPRIVNKIYDDKKNILFTQIPGDKKHSVLSSYSVEQMRLLMRETVQTGTSRRFFRGLSSQDSEDSLSIGGKTGSLTARTPFGKCDWFVGYAFEESGRKLAVGILTVHEKFWTVRSSHLARVLIENALEIQGPHSNKKIAKKN